MIYGGSIRTNGVYDQVIEAAVRKNRSRLSCRPQQSSTRPRTTWKRAALKVGEVQIGVDHLGGDDVGVIVMPP